jgi:hypothetical protein
MPRSTEAERQRVRELGRLSHGLRHRVAVACTQDKEQIEKEALERMLAENAQRVEEAQRAAEARRVADEEERYAHLAAPRVIVNKTAQLSHTPQVASCVFPAARRRRFGRSLTYRCNEFFPCGRVRAISTRVGAVCEAHGSASELYLRLCDSGETILYPCECSDRAGQGRSEKRLN